MRVHSLYLLPAALLLFCAVATSANAQNGAIVTWSDANFGFYLVNEETQMLSFHTTAWNPCTTSPDRHPIARHDISLPRDGVLVRQEHGPMFTRVYWPATEDDFWAGETPCDFITGGPIVAEGIAQLKYTDNDFNVSLTRTDSWGESLSGFLYDLAGWCGDSGVVKFDWHYRARVNKAGEVFYMNYQGPELRCKGQ